MTRDNICSERAGEGNLNAGESDGKVEKSENFAVVIFDWSPRTFKSNLSSMVCI